MEENESGTKLGLSSTPCSILKGYCEWTGSLHSLSPIYDKIMCTLAATIIPHLLRGSSLSSTSQQLKADPFIDRKLWKGQGRSHPHPGSAESYVTKQKGTFRQALLPISPVWAASGMVHFDVSAACVQQAATQACLILLY